MSETTAYQKADEATPIVTATETPTEANEELKLSNYVKLLIALTTILVVGIGVAYLMLHLDADKGIYESKIQQIKALDLHFLYLALVILGRTIQFVNLVPTVFKRGLKGNIRSNPFFFETDDEHKTTVVFKEEGRYGAYNRSNRSVQHMVEGSGGFFASIGPVGYLFPKQMLFLVVVFCIGRVLHQKGYTAKYGGHAKGFVFSLIASAATEGLALIAFVNALQTVA